MRVKVKLRAMVAYFHLEKEPVRTIFDGVLSKELMNKVEEKYPTLGAFQEAEKRELVSLTNPKLYEAMKEAASSYIEELIIKSTYVVNAEYIPTAMRLAYGKLAEDAELYFYPILRIQAGIVKLSKQERIFLEMLYGLAGEGTSSETEIIEKLGLTVSVEEYKKEVIKNLYSNLD